MPGYEEWSDRALARACALGDAEAFAAVVRRHAPAMYRFALRQLGSAADAEDVVQEALVSAWRDVGTFEGRSALRTWLLTLVARRAVDSTRVRRPTTVDDQLLSAAAQPSPDDPERTVTAHELRAALTLALAELPWNQRAAWVLREVDGLAYEEIATVLGTTTGAVRGHLHRGRRTLGERMARWR